jgi:putative membrane protein
MPAGQEPEPRIVGYRAGNTLRIILDRRIEGDEKAFAELMIADHRKAGDELAALARAKNITIPAELDAEHQEKLEKLKRLSGEALAEEYHEMQQEAHESAVALFENASKNLQDPELKAFAARTLPTLQAHRQKLGGHDHHH